MAHLGMVIAVAENNIGVLLHYKFNQWFLLLWMQEEYLFAAHMSRIRQIFHMFLQSAIQQETCINIQIMES